MLQQSARLTSYNRYPDEKGTERQLLSEYETGMQVSICYNRFPDEKGTERLDPKSTRRVCLSYNRFPDEKGTESTVSRLSVICLRKLQSFPR